MRYTISRVFTFRPLDGLEESYWIGFEQVFKSIWRWGSTGKSGSFQKWDIGEPDGEGGCARLTPYIQGVWRDWDCTWKLPYICKKFAGKTSTLLASTDYYVLSYWVSQFYILFSPGQMWPPGSWYISKRGLIITGSQIAHFQITKVSFITFFVKFI